MGKTNRDTRRGLRFTPTLTLGLAIGLALLCASATPASAAPQDEPAKVAAAPAPAPAPAAEVDTSWDPWGCNGCAPCECENYPCCTCRKPTEPKCPTKYHNLRFMENWRPCLCKSRCDMDDWSDRLKGMSVAGRLWMNVGGQVRFRWESWHGQGFGAAGPASDDSYMLGRFRLHADIHWGDNLRVFVEGMYADQWDERELGARGIDINRGDLLNAFAEWQGSIGGNSTGGIWAGRRELQYGQQRLVSPLDWANTRRTFQGAGLSWQKGGHDVDAFWTHPVTIEADSGDDWNEDVTFAGLNYRNTVMNCREWEAYLYRLERDAVGLRVDQDRWTIGGLIDGKISNTRFDWGAEAAYQFGDMGGDDISAYMACVTFGWKPCVGNWSPRIGVGLDYASGDSDPTDGTAGTFNQLFPLAHKWLGHADVLARQNVVAARFEASAKPTDKLTLLAWFHGFWRADTADAAYGVTGAPSRLPGGNTDRALGTELDIGATYKIDRHWKAFVEWAHFFTGDYFTNTGAGEDVDAVYLGIQGTF